MRKRVLSKATKVSPRDGHTIGLTIIAGSILLFTGAYIASRSSWGIFNSAFSEQSRNAKDAARSGMSYFVNELNQAENRWLSVVRNNAEHGESGCGDADGDNCQEDPDFDKVGNDPLGDLWADRNESSTILELRQNPCTVGPAFPNYARLDPGGAALVNGQRQPYGKWYIKVVDGKSVISSDSSDAKQSFRLVKVIRQPFGGHAKPPPETPPASGEYDYRDINKDNKVDENDRYLSVWRDRTEVPPGVGSVTLVVEGQSYVDGKIVASVLLEKEFELTPKCCGVPFGGEHGNVNYGIIKSGDLKGTSVCIRALGLGLVAGAAGTDTGVITVKGKATDVVDETEAAVNPIYCLASDLDACSIKVPETIDVAIIDLKLPDAYTFCNPSGGVDQEPKNGTADEVYGASNPCSSSTDIGPLPGSLSPTTFDALIASGSDFVQQSKDGKTYVINANASTLPSYCLRSTIGASQPALHCNISQIVYPNNNNIAFVTGKSPIRLYFPNADPGKKNPILKQEGNGEILHCTSYDITKNTCVGSDNTTDLTMFGSNTLPEGSQTIGLNGTADTANMYMYFPIANVDLVGTASFTGILWTNKVGSTGNPTWIIPSTGLASVFDLMDWNPNGQFEPPFYEFNLRSTNRYRWLGG